MKKTAAIRTLTALLSLIMLFSVLTACTKPDSGSGEDQTSSTADAATTEAPSNTDGNGFLLDDIPETVNFNNSTVRFLVWSDVENPEFEITEQSDNAIDNAIYTRNKTVERRLGVKLEFDAIPGNYGNQKSFISAAESRISAGSTGPHIMAAYSLCPSRK